MADNDPLQSNDYFETVTQKWVRGPFAAWSRRHGLDVTGYPLTEQFVDPETGLLTQYFQRVALEEATGQVRLRLLGQESLLRQRELAQQRAEVQRLIHEVEQLRRQVAGTGQETALEATRNTSAENAGLLTQLLQREEELAEAQMHLARMERELDACQRRAAELQSQLNQQSVTLAAQQAEIARLRAQLQQGGGSQTPVVVAKPSMRDVVDQLQKHPTRNYPTRQLKAITHICIHHSAVAGTVPVDNIAKYHVESKDWAGIGYHYYVTPDGTIYETQRLQTASWHVTHNNDRSAGICVAGDFTYAPPPQIQIDAAARLTAWLMQDLKVPEKNVLGHREFPGNDTSCPGETWLKRMTWKTMLLEAVRAVQGGGQPGGTVKPLGHYVLFWQTPNTWAQQDWLAAEQYIGRFRPTSGFSLDDAQNAEFVTIVGGDAGVSYAAEQMLRAAGAKVERVAGVDYADTKRILDEMAASGQRFLTLN